MKSCSILLLGDKWKLYVLSTAEFHSCFSTKFAAITDAREKKIAFDAAELSLGLVVHELTHAYFSYFCLTSATIKQVDMEEIFCEFMSQHAAKVLKESEAALKKLQRLV